MARALLRRGLLAKEARIASYRGTVWRHAIANTGEIRGTTCDAAGDRAMDGLMMTPPLRLPPFLERAERYFGDREVVTRASGILRRSSWREIGRRAQRVASALDSLGLAPFDRVATLAWNTDRHVELYYAIPGSRRILHTLNLRLHADQLAWIASHADDRVIFVDDVLLPIAEAIAPKLRGVKAWVVLGDGPLPKTALEPVLRYEDLVERGDPEFRFVD